MDRWYTGGAGYKVTVPETGKDCGTNMGEIRVTSDTFRAELNKRHKACTCSVPPPPPPCPPGASDLPNANVLLKSVSGASYLDVSV